MFFEGAWQMCGTVLFHRWLICVSIRKSNGFSVYSNPVTLEYLNTEMGSALYKYLNLLFSKQVICDLMSEWQEPMYIHQSRHYSSYWIDRNLSFSSVFSSKIRFIAAISCRPSLTHLTTVTKRKTQWSFPKTVTVTEPMKIIISGLVICFWRIIQRNRYGSTQDSRVQAQYSSVTIHKRKVTSPFLLSLLSFIKIILIINSFFIHFSKIMFSLWEMVGKVSICVLQLIVY